MDKNETLISIADAIKLVLKEYGYSIARQTITNYCAKFGIGKQVGPNVGVRRWKIYPSKLREILNEDKAQHGTNRKTSKKQSKAKPTTTRKKSRRHK